MDECVTQELRHALIGHTVATVRHMGWHNVKNGELLRRADGQFDVLLTVDQNLEYQQNLKGEMITMPTCELWHAKPYTFWGKPYDCEMR